MYCLYYPDEGRYSYPMPLSEARELAQAFICLYVQIVDIRTGEVMN